MKTNRSLIITLLVFIVIAALYRLIPGRPMGFAPQLAMSLFAGAVIKDKKWAFAFPILSLFISDLLFHVLFLRGMVPYPGFYQGQLTNYILFAAMTVIGFLVKKISVLNVILYSFIVALTYFFLSNFLVWQGGGGYGHPKTAAGLTQTLIEGLPFFRNSLIATLMFSAILFGGLVVFTRKAHSPLAA